MSERAICYFQEQSCRNDVSHETVLYNNRAIWALRKQVPMLVNHERTFWHYYHYCPDCSELLSREGLRYCDRCGQRLDWSNYEAGLTYLRSV